MLTKALLVRLEALPGKEAELADFLTEARTIVMEEPGTIAWFAIQFGPSHPRHDSDVPHLISRLAVWAALGPHVESDQTRNDP